MTIDWWCISVIIIHQIFSLTCDWSKRVTWPNIPQLKLWNIREYLTVDAAQLLVHDLATSKLDYCNSLLYGLPKCLINQLQRVQNAAARVVTVSSKFCHFTPVLKNLHWLSIDLRIEFKILIITYKALHGFAPTYIKDLLKNYHPPRDLRSVFKEESTCGPCVSHKLLWPSCFFCYCAASLEQSSSTY